MEVYALWAEDGTLAWFENRGGWFEEEEGLLGADVVELFNMVALGVSAGDSESTLGADSGDMLGETKGKSIRVVSSNTDDFAAIGRDARRSHFDGLSIRCLEISCTRSSV